MFLLRLRPHTATNLQCIATVAPTGLVSYKRLLNWLDSCVCVQQHTWKLQQTFHSANKMNWVLKSGWASIYNFKLVKHIFFFVSFWKKLNLIGMKSHCTRFSLLLSSRNNLYSKYYQNPIYSACAIRRANRIKADGKQLIRFKLMSNSTNGNTSCRVRYQYKMIFHWDAHM